MPQVAAAEINPPVHDEPPPEPAAAPREKPPAPPVGPTPLFAGQRLHGLDVVRVFAALTVIWHHALRSPDLRHVEAISSGTWGTSFFNFLAAFLMVASVQRRPDRTYGQFVRDRFQRLYLPFLIWAAVSILARIPNRLILGRTTTLEPSVHLLWHGGTYHLWFLPYVLVASLVTAPIVSWGLHARVRAIALSAAMLGLGLAGTVLFSIDAMRMQASADPNEAIAGHWLFRFPLFMIGIAAALAAIAFPLVFAAARRFGPVWLSIMVGSIVMRHVWAVWPGVTVRTGAISGFLTGVSVLGSREPGWLARLGRLSFGAYLCHYLFVEGAIAVFRAAGMPRDYRTDLGVFVIAAVGSFTTAAILKRFRATAWMIP